MVVSTLVGALFAGLLSAAAACTCAFPPDDAKCGRDNDYVLRGVAKANEPIQCSVNRDTTNSGVTSVQDAVTLASFEVTTVLRQPEGGTLSDGDTVNIRATVAGNLCGYQVEPDVEYVLFAFERGPEDCEVNPDSRSVFLDTGLVLGTTSCSGNIREPSGEELGQLEADCDSRDEGPDDEGVPDLDCGLPDLPPCEPPVTFECLGALVVGADGFCTLPQVPEPECGFVGQEPCPGQRCIAGVQIAGTCEACGSRGEPLCPVSGCTAPFVPWHIVAGIRRCGLGSTRSFVEE